MTRVRRINVSQIEGDNANNSTTNEIRPYGELAVYVGDNDKLELLMFDGVRTHVKSKVLNKGTFYGGDADSSDGLNYDTIKLVPDEELRRNGSNQYLIIDPTYGEPGHIHIRAGGTIDQSTADLFLGGEKNHIRVSDVSDRVVISTENGEGTHNWTLNSYGELRFPDDTVQTTAYQSNTGSWIVTSSTNIYSFTVPPSGTYSMWVRGNIPNGIIVWNATVTVTNTNVPAIGQQFAWNYTGAGSPILLTSLPDQIIGTAGVISTDNTYVGTASNVFAFGISNTSGSDQVVEYRYVKI